MAEKYTPEQLQYLKAALKAESELLPESTGKEKNIKDLSSKLLKASQEDPGAFALSELMPYEYGGKDPIVRGGTTVSQDELLRMLDSDLSITGSNPDKTGVFRDIQDLLDMPEGVKKVPEGTASRNVLKDLKKQSDVFNKAEGMRDLISEESEAFKQANPDFGKPKIQQFKESFKEARKADIDALTALKKGGKMLGKAGSASLGAVAGVAGAPVVGDILMPDELGPEQGSPESVMEDPSASPEARRDAMNMLRNKYIRGK